MLFSGLPSEEDMRDIITEFNILKHVGRHENIVGLLGASEHNGEGERERERERERNILSL